MQSVAGQSRSEYHCYFNSISEPTLLRAVLLAGGLSAGQRIAGQQEILMSNSLQQ